MAIFYLRSTDGSDVSDGSTWALAKATLVGAFTAMSAGDTLYVSQVHAEAQALNMSLTSPGTKAAPCFVICANDAAEPPTAVATTATIDTTGNQNIDFTAGHTYFYGISFRTSTTVGANSSADIAIRDTADASFVFEDCALRIKSTSSSADVICSGGAQEGLIEFINTDVEFGNPGQELLVGYNIFMWRGGTLTGNQSNVFRKSGTACGRFHVVGVDLSVCTNNLMIVDASDYASDLIFQNCKLGATVTLVTGLTEGPGSSTAELINCDSGDTNYRHDFSSFMGDMTTETVVVRTGGASDGTTPISWQIDTAATPEWHTPFKTPWVAGWINETGAKTLTAQIIHDSVTNLQDDEVWLEVEYLGTAGFPMSLRASDKAADILATAADQSLVGAPWTTTGLTNPNTQDCSVAITVNEIGPFRARLCVNKASYTTYFCPKVEVS